MDIYEKAVKKWGEDLQIVMMMEECAELIQACSKYLRKKDIGNIMKLKEEIADVSIMLKQFEYIFGDFQNEKVEKLKRLKDMLEKS